MSRHREGKAISPGTWGQVCPLDWLSKRQMVASACMAGSACRGPESTLTTGPSRKGTQGTGPRELGLGTRQARLVQNGLLGEPWTWGDLLGPLGVTQTVKVPSCGRPCQRRAW